MENVWGLAFPSRRDTLVNVAPFLVRIDFWGATGTPHGIRSRLGGMPAGCAAAKFRAGGIFVQFR